MFVSDLSSHFKQIKDTKTFKITIWFKQPDHGAPCLLQTSPGALRWVQKQSAESRYKSGHRQQFLPEHILPPSSGLKLDSNIFYSISAVRNKVLLFKNGGLLSAGKSWRGCSRNCHEVSAQNIWPGDCLQEGFQLMTHRLNKVVALKKVPLKRLEDGISEATIREIKALQQLESQFVVKWENSWVLNPSFHRLYDVFPQGMGFVLVFEFMVSDLSEVIRDAQNPLSREEVKCYMLMLLRGVAFLHEREVMHR